MKNFQYEKFKAFFVDIYSSFLFEAGGGKSEEWKVL
jgi:hypothetical protein